MHDAIQRFVLERLQAASTGGAVRRDWAIERDHGVRDQDPHRSAFTRRLHLGDGRRQEKGPLRVCLRSRPSGLCGERRTQQSPGNLGRVYE